MVDNVLMDIDYKNPNYKLENNKKFFKLYD